MIDGINCAILDKALVAAQLAWITGDESYAQFAFTIFDTYMRGMYYREEPIDLLRGHSQNIYGMSTFEVIQEGVLETLATTYDFLYGYIRRNHAEALPLYADTFRKWIGVTIHNGVPFNNWDLIEARFIVHVALVLEDDAAYADGHGAEYFLNFVLNQNATRQWSLTKLAASGFDPHTGIWNESPGYSRNVVTDFIALFNEIDEAIGTDLIEEIPVVRKAALALAQYALPSGTTVAWGDSYYQPFQTRAAWLMVANARLHHRRDQEALFTGMIRYFDALMAGEGKQPEPPRHGLNALFDRADLRLDSSFPALQPGQLFTSTFSAPLSSYLTLRSGFTPANGLMISEAGSLGNHQHANGISMELYGAGLPLVPDSGIGSNYFEPDHADYYSQFPAHNTVVVDGISGYPTMKSHHGFTVNALFPATGEHENGETPVTFSDVSFLEPETNADQRRVTAIVRTSPQTGYYLDIFRSARRDHHDLKHDYFFHGLGQSLDLRNEHDQELAQSTTEKLTFADEELGAYDYLWDKHSVAQAATYHATYRLSAEDRPETQLNVWMAGAKDRTLFSVLAPSASSLHGIPSVQFADQPLHTLVMRQLGEAWTHPFVSVIETSNAKAPAAINAVKELPITVGTPGAVALRVEEASGAYQIILQADPATNSSVTSVGSEDDILHGSLGIVNHAEDDSYLFLGNGTSLASEGYEIKLLGGSGTAFLRRDPSGWQIETTRAAEITVASCTGKPILHINGTSIEGQTASLAKLKTATLTIPATKLTHAEFACLP